MTLNELVKVSKLIPLLPPAALFPNAVGLAWLDPLTVPLAASVELALLLELAVIVGSEPAPVACVTGRSTELAAVKVDEEVPLLSLSKANLAMNFMMTSFASSLVGPSPMTV